MARRLISKLEKSLDIITEGIFEGPLIYASTYGFIRYVSLLYQTSINSMLKIPYGEADSGSDTSSLKTIKRIKKENKILQDAKRKYK